MRNPFSRPVRRERDALDSPAFNINEPDIQPYLMRRLDRLPPLPVKAIPAFAAVALFGNKGRFWKFDVIAGRPTRTGDYLLFGQETRGGKIGWRFLTLSQIKVKETVFLQTHLSRIKVCPGTIHASPFRSVTHRAAKRKKKSGRGMSDAINAMGRRHAYAPESGCTAELKA